MKRGKQFLSLLLTTLLLFTLFGVPAQAVTTTFNTNAEMDAFPSGWSVSGTSVTASGENLYATSTTAMTDGKLSTTFVLRDDAAVQVGFYFRASSRTPRPIDNGYVVYIHRAGSISRVELNSGDWSGAALKTYNYSFQKNTEYTLSAEVKGSSIKILLDSQEIMTLTDSTHSSGEIGLFRAGGSVEYKSFQFGDVQVGSLLVNGAAIDGFSGSVKDYTVEVNGDVSAPPVVSAEKVELTDTIVYEQATSIPGTATVTVTDADGISGIYHVSFVRKTSLNSLKVNGEDIPEFNAAIHSYTYLLPEGTVTVPGIVGTASDTSAKITYEYPLALPGKVKITVSSADRTASTVYSVYCYAGTSPYLESNIATIKNRIGFDSVANAVRDLTVSYPDQYDSKYIERLVEYESQIMELALEYALDETLPSTVGVSMKDGFQTWGAAALKANPLLTGQKWVFETRKQYAADHQNTHTMFPTAKWEYNDGYFQPGGALKTIDFSTGVVETLVSTSSGLYCDPDVSWDGNKLLFSYRVNEDDSFHIYEMDLATKQVTQLTSMEYADDLYALYLPNDQIVFGSNREPKYVMCNTHLQSNLYVMNFDGSNIHQITKNTLFDRCSSIMADGRILYDRWEYTDRDFGDAQGLWAVAPDGTNSVHLYGNYLSSPGGVIDGVEIPGTTKMLAVLAGCHDRPWGALALIDTALGDGEQDSILQTWPSNAIDYVIDGSEGAVEAWDYIMNASGTRYEDPYPLDDHYFVVSKTLSSGQVGLVLLDLYGNETVLYQESGLGVFRAKPITSRERANVITERRGYDYDYDTETGTGTLYVENVYIGTNMEGVEPGAAKTLRIVEAIEKRQYGKNGHWAGKGGQQPGMSWSDLLSKRIWGEVPIEEDGSCYFEVPSDKFLYFQILDEDGKVIQTMRSGTVVQEGELTGCVGCHEDRRTTPVKTSDGTIPMALKKEAVKLNGWSADTTADTSERKIENFGYMTEVQPVFTRNCLSCHDFGGTGASKIVLAADTNLVFNTSYNEIWNKGYINVAGAGPAIHYDAYEKGSHASLLIQVLDSESHAAVRAKMSDADYNALVTWIDLNGVFYSDYVSPFRENMSGRSPLAARDLLALNQLTGIQMGGGYDYTTNQVYHIYSSTAQWDMRTNIGPLITFERPELSPVLSMGTNLNQNKNSTAYKQAIALIEKGKAAMEERPQIDTEGYQIDGMDAFRQALYNYRTDVNYQFLKAIQEGRKLYDPGIKEGADTYEPFAFEDWTSIIGPVSDLTKNPTGAGDVEGNIPRLGAGAIPTVNTADPYGGKRSQPFEYITVFAAGADVNRHEDYSFMIGR